MILNLAHLLIVSYLSLTAALLIQPKAAVPASAQRTLNENKYWKWRDQSIRYVVHGEKNTGPTVLLVHGLFVNADHFRKNLPALAAAGYRAYAIDLLGKVLPRLYSPSY